MLIYGRQNLAKCTFLCVISYVLRVRILLSSGRTALVCVTE